MNTRSVQEQQSVDGRQPPQSLRAFLHELIDYAGLFPPAKLDMATTVQNYSRYIQSEDAWLVARLIIPVARLDEFEREAANLLPTDDETDPWPISALTAPAGSEELNAHLDRIAQFNEQHAQQQHGRALIDVIELKASDTTAIDAALDAVPDELFPFFEIAANADPRGLVASFAGSDAGAKIRTGGVTADLYPKPEDVARFIVTCAQANVPFKATAGLHHPVRHFSNAVGTEEFGFLNLFTAAAFAYHKQRGVEELLPVLIEQEAGAFAFSDEGLRWQDQQLSTDELEDTRLAFALSFGSCSIDEPREDLRQLKLI